MCLDLVRKEREEEMFFYDTEGSAARLFNTKPRSITPGVCVQHAGVFYLLCRWLLEQQYGREREKERKETKISRSSSPRALESCNLIFFLKTLDVRRCLTHTHTHTHRWRGVIPDGRTKREKVASRERQRFSRSINRRIQCIHLNCFTLAYGWNYQTTDKGRKSRKKKEILATRCAHSQSERERGRHGQPEVKEASTTSLYTIEKPPNSLEPLDGSRSRFIDFYFSKSMRFLNFRRFIDPKKKRNETAPVSLSGSRT